MRKLVAALAVAIGLAVVAKADILYTYDFSTDGATTNGANWHGYSGNDGSITNGGGVAWIGAGAEDIGATNVYAAQANLFYLGVDLNVIQAGSSSTGTYTFGFLQGSSTMAGRMHIDDIDSTTYRLGLSGDGGAVIFSTNVLTEGITYRVVLGYDNSTDSHTLWVNPLVGDAATPNLSITEAVTASPNGVFFRQAAPYQSGTASWTADNLVVATDFASAVVPEPTTFAIFGLGFAAIAAYRRRKA